MRVLPIAGLLLFALVSLWIGLRGDDNVGDPGFLAAYAVLFGLMLLLWRRWPAGRPVHWALLAALAARMAFLSFPAGDDVNRYVWEGIIQNHGHNPFLTAPDSPELEHLRNELWEGINHKSIPTIYWPFAQLLFRGVARLSPTIMGFKLLFVVFDVLTMAVLLALLRRLGQPRRHLFLYAFNPLVLTFTAGEGHLEIVAVFWIVSALYFVAIERPALMFLALGMGIMTKVTPLILVPFALRRDTVRWSWMLLVPFLPALLYVRDLETLWATPLMFATEFRYNGLLQSLLTLYLPRPAVVGILSLIAASLSGYILLFVPNTMRAWAAAAYVFILCSPTVHPWYLLMVTPFLVLFRSPAWITLHLTAVAVIFIWQPGVAPWWRNREMLLLVEYVPFVVAAVWTTVRAKRRWPVHYPPPRSVSVIVPALNEAQRIEACLQSVLSHDAEIIVVDGGSTDGTPELVRKFASVKVVTAAPGRGIQIKKGVDCARSDVVLVLHADSRLAPGTLERAVGILEDNPEAVGGAFGATYDSAARRYRLVELLNNLRAILTGISFGDQAQFFRRTALADQIPPFRLMEDIELSLAMKQHGAVVFLRHGVISSTRRWERSRYAANVFKVISLSLSFMVRRRLGALSPDCGEYYRAYYGKDACEQR